MQSGATRHEIPEVKNSGSTPKHARPSLGSEKGREALEVGGNLRAHVQQLAPQHRRSFRRRRRIALATRIVIYAVVVAVVVAVAIFAPWDEWWADLQRWSENG